MPELVAQLLGNNARGYVGNAARRDGRTSRGERVGYFACAQAERAAARSPTVGSAAKPLANLRRLTTDVDYALSSGPLLALDHLTGFFEHYRWEARFGGDEYASQENAFDPEKFILPYRAKGTNDGLPLTPSVSRPAPRRTTRRLPGVLFARSRCGAIKLELENSQIGKSIF